MRLGDNRDGVRYPMRVERHVAPETTITYRRDSLVPASRGRQRGSASASTG
jgi:hypothetical protein